MKHQYEALTLYYTAKKEAGYMEHQEYGIVYYSSDMSVGKIPTELIQAQ